MKILSIETSCDETAISLVEAKGGLESPSFSILGNSIISQINLHKEYGGVYPMLAKREHAKNLIPILIKVLNEASMFIDDINSTSQHDWETIENFLVKEDGLYLDFKKNLENIKPPEIDLISVTKGPGLAPALWVGIVFAEALGKLWNIPVVGVNHMEGHIASVLINKTEEFSISNFQFLNKSNLIKFPALALLISGGHTELVKIDNWGSYTIIGETRDDAVGEAFDKVARMLNLPYPGGPEISKLAEFARKNSIARVAKLPRPMISSNDLNFSFSGLKTSVLYYIRDNFKTDPVNSKIISENEMADIAREFEDSVVDVLLSKTKEALDETGVQTLIIAGGVIANKKLREVFKALETERPGLLVRIPSNSLTTDNALMIAAATYINVLKDPSLLHNTDRIKALGNLKLGENR